jgi:PAS domain S-box-containing protein
VTEHRSPFDSTDLRRRAERTLLGRDLASKAGLDPIRLLHELQVHQVELEIQNEELVAANHDLEALRTKYQLLYESAPVAYLTLSSSGEVIECNAKAVEMLSLQHDDVLKRPLRDFFDAASCGAFDVLLTSATLQAVATADELILQRPKGLPIYVQAQARMLQLPHQDEKLYLFAMMDISLRKFAMEDVARVIQESTGTLLPKQTDY